MWIIIISVVILIMVNLLFSRSNLKKKTANQKIQTEGSMTKKYAYLIDQFTGSRGKVVREDNTSIIIEASSIGGTITITLTQLSVQIVINWKLDSPVFGLHFQQWKFSEDDDQVKIVERICEDMKAYNTRNNF